MLPSLLISKLGLDRRPGRQGKFERITNESLFRKSINLRVDFHVELIKNPSSCQVLCIMRCTMVAFLALTAPDASVGSGPSWDSLPTQQTPALFSPSTTTCARSNGSFTTKYGLSAEGPAARYRVTSSTALHASILNSSDNEHSF